MKERKKQTNKQREKERYLLLQQLHLRLRRTIRVKAQFLGQLQLGLQHLHLDPLLSQLGGQCACIHDLVLVHPVHYAFGSTGKAKGTKGLHEVACCRGDAADHAGLGIEG